MHFRPIFLCALLTTASAAPAAVIFFDDFDSYRSQPEFETVWSKIGAESAVLSTERYVSPPQSIKTLASATGTGGNYRNFGGDYLPSDAQPLVVSFYMSFDSGATRQFNEIRGYTGAGYNDGSLVQLYAVGTYSSVTAPGEVYDGTRYQARVAFGTDVGWFNLNAPGAPSRSDGWHKFEMEVKSTVVNFYVDDVLGRSWPRGTVTDLDCALLGSRLTNPGGAAWTDDFGVEQVPEPAALALLSAGLLLVRRRSGTQGP